MTIRQTLISALFVLMGASCRADWDTGNYRGKVLVLDFWASWCTPCRESFPWLNDLQTREASAGLVIVGINEDESMDDAQRFLKKHPVNFAVIYDSAGKIAGNYEMQGLPYAVVIDRKGRVRYHHAGFNVKERAVREQEIQDLLHEK